MANPIKAIKGGVQGVKVKAAAISLNNKIVKAGDSVKPTVGAAMKKQTMTPVKVVKAFAAGAKNPTKASDKAKELKAFGAGKKPGAK